MPADSGPDDRGGDAVALDLLERLLADRRGGHGHDLRHYRALYPGFEDAVDALWQRLGAPPPPPEPVSLGPYRLLAEIARGGQAVVWRARDDELQRDVALKVLRLGPESSLHAVERFRREARLLSRLDHPGLCPIHAVGSEHGTAWIAMRLVPGTTLAERLRAADRPPPTWREAAVLLEQAARAVHVAHEAGVVHRDLKPSNVMITPEGTPVVLDFGLAHDQLDELGGATRTGELLGTPAYMAPEQVEGRAVDRRTDVHALGVMLFEGLAAARPFDAPTRDELYRRLLREPPSLRALRQRGVPRDLVAIVAKALEKQPDRRYATARGFADDLRAALAGEPVSARTPSPLERTGRWVARNRAVAAAGGVTVLGLAVGLAVAVSAAARARAAERHARMLALASIAQREAGHAPALAVELALAACDRELGPQALESLADGLSGLRLRSEVEVAPGPIAVAALSPDGETIAVAAGGRVLLCELARPAPRQLLAGDARVTALCWVGRGLAVGDDAGAARWVERDGTATVAAALPAPITAVGAAADGGSIAVAAADGTVAILGSAGGERRRLVLPSAAHAVHPFDDGGGVAALVDGALLVRPRDGDDRDIETTPWGRSWAVTRDGGRIAVPRLDSATAPPRPAVHIEELATGRSALVGADFRNEVGCLAFDASGQRLLIGLIDTCCVCVDLLRSTSITLRGAPLGPTYMALGDSATLVAGASTTVRGYDRDGHGVDLRDHGARPLLAALSGEEVVTFAGDGILRRWSPWPALALDLGLHLGEINRARWLGGGRAVLAVQDRGVWCCEPAGPPRLLVPEVVAWNAVPRADGARMLVLHLHGGATSVDPRSGDAVTLPVVGTAVGGVFLADGDVALLAGREVGVWDAAGRRIAARDDHRAALVCGAGAADGTWFVTADESGVAVLRGPDGSARQRLAAHAAAVCSVAIAGDELALGSLDGTASWWRADGSAVAAVGRAGGPAVRSVALAGGTLATGFEDGTATLWDGAGRAVARLRGHSAPVLAVAATGDGRLWATGSQDGRAALWHRDGSLVLQLPDHGGEVRSLEFSADGRELLCAGMPGQACLWPTDPSELVARARRLRPRGLRAGERARYGALLE